MGRVELQSIQHEDFLYQISFPLCIPNGMILEKRNACGFKILSFHYAYIQVNLIQIGIGHRAFCMYALFPIQKRSNFEV